MSARWSYLPDLAGGVWLKMCGDIKSVECLWGLRGVEPHGHAVFSSGPVWHRPAAAVQSQEDGRGLRIAAPGNSSGAPELLLSPGSPIKLRTRYGTARFGDFTTTSTSFVELIQPVIKEVRRVVQPLKSRRSRS